MLIGREQELARLRALLETERVVALVGPSGVGKTAIAQVLAASMASVFVDCYGVAPGELVPRIIQAIEERADPDLLVLDNWPTGAPPPDETFDQRILLTTHVPPPRGVTLAVTPFDVPARAHLEQSDAFRAFQAVVERTLVGAGEQIDLEAAHGLIRALGGHPLGITIAARHAAVFGTSEVLRLLREGIALEDPDRDARQQTLERSLEFSWQQLNDDQQLALYALARFQRPVRVTSLADVLGRGVGETMTVLGELARAGIVSPGPYPRPLELWVDIGLRLDVERSESAAGVSDRIYEIAVTSAPERFMADPGEIGDAPSFWEAAVLRGIDDRPRDARIKIVLALLGWSLSFGPERYRDHDHLADTVTSLRSTRAHILRAKLLPWRPSSMNDAIEAAWDCTTTNEERALVELERASLASQRLDLPATLEHIAAARSYHDSPRAKVAAAWFHAFVDPAATPALVAEVLADPDATARMRAAIGPAATWTAAPDRRVAVAREFLERAKGLGDLEVTMNRVLADALDYAGRGDEAALVRQDAGALASSVGYDRMTQSLEAEQLFANFAGPNHPSLDALRSVPFQSLLPDVRARVASAIVVEACVTGLHAVAMEFEAELGLPRLSFPPSDPFERVASAALALASGAHVADGEYTRLMVRVHHACDADEVEQLALLEDVERLLKDATYPGRLAARWVRHHLPPLIRRVVDLAGTSADVVILSDFRTFRASGAWHRVPELTAAVLRTIATGEPREFDEIAAEVWPGETIEWEALVNRVNVRMAALRKCGLRPHLIKGSDGFVLEGAIEIEPS